MYPPLHLHSHQSTRIISNLWLKTPKLFLETILAQPFQFLHRSQKKVIKLQLLIATSLCFTLWWLPTVTKVKSNILNQQSHSPCRILPLPALPVSSHGSITPPFESLTNWSFLILPNIPFSFQQQKLPIGSGLPLNLAKMLLTIELPQDHLSPSDILKPLSSEGSWSSESLSLSSPKSPWSLCKFTHLFPSDLIYIRRNI